VTWCSSGKRWRRVPEDTSRVPAVPHLLGYRTVDILWDAAGHQIDRDGTNKVPAESRVVLQTIARAILRVGREQGRNKMLARGRSPAHQHRHSWLRRLSPLSPPLLRQVCS